MKISISSIGRLSVFFWFVWLYAASCTVLITIGAGAWILGALPALIKGQFRATLGEVAILGLGVLYVLFSIMHLVLPLSYGLGAAALLAAGGLLTQRKALRGLIREQSAQRYRLGFPLAFLSMSAVVFLSYPEYDSGLYHFQTVLWYFEKPLVLGLANLHFRLGFNSAESLWGAGFLIDKSAYWMALLPNVALLTGFGWAVLDRVADLAAIQGQRLSAAFVAMLPLGLMMANIDTLMASLGGNAGSAVLFCALVMSVIVLAAVPQSIPRDEPAPIVLVLLLATLAVLIKVTAAAGAIVAVIIAIIQTFRRRVRLKPILIVIALCSTATLLMVIRSYAMNGCLLVFISQSCIHVPWAIKPDYADYLHIEAIAWGRAGGDPTASGKTYEQWANGYDWISPLLIRLCDTIIAPFANLLPSIELWIRSGFINQPFTNKAFLVIVLLIGTFFYRIFNKNHVPKRHYEGILKNNILCFLQAWSVIISGLVFWFFTAPDLRYSSGPRACIMAAVLAACLLPLLSKMPSKLPVLCLALMPLSVASAIPYKLFSKNHEGSMAERVFPLPRSAVNYVYSADGTMVAVAVNDHCDITPIPCTPYPAGIEKLRFGEIWRFPAIYYDDSSG